MRPSGDLVGADERTTGQPAPPARAPRSGPRWGLVAGSTAVLAVALSLLVLAVWMRGPEVDDASGSPSSSTTAEPGEPTVPAPASTVTPATTHATATIPGVDVSQIAIAARIDEYLAAGAGNDLARFQRQWRYPIDNYYGVPQATRDDVAAKADEYWSTYPQRSFIRIGEPVVDIDTTVRAQVSFRFVLTSSTGEVRCGTNTLTVDLDRTPGLPIRSIEEAKGTTGC